MFQNFNLTYTLISLPVILLSLTLHEIAHGYTAYKLGDFTAKNDGRLSLNPLRHIDPIGFILLLIFHFGWAKPVMINPYNLKDPKKDMAVISLAGPLTNFLLSLLFFIPMLIMANMEYANVFLSILYYFLQIGYSMNILLAVFNILPLPPLDGSKVFGSLLPDRIYYNIMRFDSRISMVILLLLSYSGWLSKILTPMMNSVNSLYNLAGSFILGLFR